MDDPWWIDGIKVGFEPVQPDPWPPPLWLPIPGQRAVPYRFWALIWDTAQPQPYLLRLRVQVESPTNVAVIHTLVVERWDGPPVGPDVTTARLRKINLRRYLRLVIDRIAEPITSAEADTGVRGTFWVETEPRHGPFDGAHIPGRIGRGRAQADRSRLDVVADAYKAAKAAGQPVREAVMLACHVETSQAQRLIRAAREAGKLPPR